MTDQNKTHGVLSDAEIIALNDGEKFFSVSESRFAPHNPHLQYHTGEPGLIEFARALEAAVLAKAAPQSPVAPADERALMALADNIAEYEQREKFIAWCNAAPTLGQKAPDGWRLVPVEHTVEMTVAFAEVWYTKRRAIDDHDMQDAYAAMLNAAPTPPTSAADKTTKGGSYHPLRNIAEWRNGCSCADGGKPETCGPCTLELIDAIESWHKTDHAERPQYEIAGHFLNTASAGKREHWETVSADHAWDADVVTLYRRFPASNGGES